MTLSHSLAQLNSRAVLLMETTEPNEASELGWLLWRLVGVLEQIASIDATIALAGDRAYAIHLNMAIGAITNLIPPDELG